MLFLLGSLFYFSWLPSPNLGQQLPMPGWLEKFTNEYGNLRTAVPTFLLALCWGFYVKLNGLKMWQLGMIVPIVALLVSLAELGQLSLPLRSFDLGDIFWGTVGAIAGVFLWLCVGLLTTTAQKIKPE